MAILDRNGNPVVFGAPSNFSASTWATTASAATISQFGAPTSVSSAIVKEASPKRTSSSVDTALSSSMEPPAKRIKWNGEKLGQIVKIVAGPEEIEVSIQKSLPCAESKFLEAELEKDVESGGTNKVVIAEHSSMAVLMFTNWLLTTKVETLEEYTDIRSGSQETQDVITELKAQWSALADCFRLGEYLVAGRFKNDVMDALVSKSKEIHELGDAAGLTSDQLNAIYDGTNESSPLRRLVLHNFLVSEVENIIDELDDSLPKVREFLKDVAKYTVSKLRESSSNDNPATSEEPWNKDPCEYHEHIDQEEGFCCTKR